MIFAILPVKSPRNSKHRLASLLSAAERERLAWLMYERTLEVLLHTPALDRIAVASSDPGVIEHAERLGAMVLAETEQKGHSHSADRAAAFCAAHRARMVLLVPIDVPLLSAGDVEQALAAAGSLGVPGVVVVPSQDGTGTNSLACTPPGIIACRFGPGSFEAHANEARQRGAALGVAHPSGLVFDLDTPGDLAGYLAQRPSGVIADFLVQIGARARIVACGQSG